MLYYAFAVLITPMAADLHTSTATVTGALTTSVLVSAVAAVPVGRWLDRHGGRTLMTFGAVLGVVAVLTWSLVDQVWQLYATFVIIGLASAASLYEAAFAVIIATTPAHARSRALLAVTVLAGFASSIFLPLTGVLLHHLGWRTTLVVLGALLATTIPAHAIVVPARTRPAARRDPHARRSWAVLRDGSWWLLAGGFVAQAAGVAAVGVLLIVYLRGIGHSPTAAATLAGMLGVLSVTGRLVTTHAARRLGMTTITAAVFALQAVSVLALPYLGRSTVGAAICVTGFGLGFGVATIARPAILADRYGTARYATIAATMTTPITATRALAPLPRRRSVRTRFCSPPAWHA
ncbi:MFS transporter [Luedemannella flava]